jgi:hypothetical protein
METGTSKATHPENTARRRIANAPEITAGQPGHTKSMTRAGPRQRQAKVLVIAWVRSDHHGNRRPMGVGRNLPAASRTAAEGRPASLHTALSEERLSWPHMECLLTRHWAD